MVRFSFLLTLLISTVPGDLVVTSLESTGPGSLREAITNAEPNERITFDPSLSGGSIFLQGEEFLINKNLEIDGTGLERAITIDGESESRHFHIPAPDTHLTLRLLILQKGRSKTIPFADGSDGWDGANGGSILNNGILTLDRLLSRNNSIRSGSCDFNHHLGECTHPRGIHGKGGALYNSGTASISQCTFSQNHSIVNVGDATVNFSTLISTYISSEGTLSINGTASDSTISDIFQGNHNFIRTKNDPFDLMLGPLIYNGGPIPTFVAFPGSPLIDQGPTTTSIAYDQRGRARVVGVSSDIGATEYDSLLDGETRYQRWAIRSIPDGQDRSFNADHDRNGYSNGMEYALGADISSGISFEQVRPRAEIDPRTGLALLSGGREVQRDTELNFTIEVLDPDDGTWSIEASTAPGWDNHNNTDYFVITLTGNHFMLLSRRPHPRLFFRVSASVK